MNFLLEHHATTVPLGYLLSTAFFILGLKQLASPATARRGNFLGGVGMLLAVLATLAMPGVENYQEIGIAIGIGSILGLITAFRVQMTEMPQMVAIFNGLGGGASALVALSEFTKAVELAESAGVLSTEAHLSVLLGAVIGGVTLTGSFVAFGKLQGLIDTGAVVFSGQQVINAGIGLAILGGSYQCLSQGPSTELFLLVTALSLALGVLLVIPIGGADMPVVIALLNSYSGLAASMAGFALGNFVLIIAGALVGASGLILTQIMCRAMNRSIFNVMFGAFGAQAASKKGGADQSDKVHKSTTVEDAAMMLAYADSVVFVPGYGMAVAQAQHECRELADLLEGKGVEISFAIHPVAGRMPGHMNVLLAEANVPYPKLIEMEDINPEFERTSVSVVIGANDVVNPAARHDEASPIYGMPILDVDKSDAVIILKRSMRPGFAGIQNELFFDPKTYMLFGDAKDSLGGLVKEVKGL